MPKKIYIAGKVTGLQQAELRYKFDTAAAQLTAEGYEVKNPLDIVNNEDEPWISAMKKCLRVLLDCDEIYMLHDWHESNGAIMEHGIAKALHIQIRYSSRPAEAPKDEPHWEG